MNPATPPLCELAESVTVETLPLLFSRLFTRPEPQQLEFTRLIIESAAETLHRTSFSVYCDYSDYTGFKSLQIAEILWKRSYPGVLDILKPKVRMGVILQFPADNLNRKSGVAQ